MMQPLLPACHQPMMKSHPVCLYCAGSWVKLSIVRISCGSQLHLQSSPVIRDNTSSQAVNCDTSALFLSYLSSRMFLITDALLISQNFSVVSGHIAEETFNTWDGKF